MFVKRVKFWVQPFWFTLNQYRYVEVFGKQSLQNDTKTTIIMDFRLTEAVSCFWNLEIT